MSKERTERELAERALVMQVLRDDHPERWSRAELERELSTIEPLEISDALAQLSAAGVVILEGEQVRASGCARHLDALNVICI
jgi:hypothetical protein